MNSSTLPFHPKIILETISDSVKIPLGAFCALILQQHLATLISAFYQTYWKWYWYYGPVQQNARAMQQLPPNHSLFI